MATNKSDDEIQGTEKEFLDLYNKLCYCRPAWQVWSDLMSAMACAISNATEMNPKRRAEREKEYEHCIKQLGGSVEIPAKLLAIVTISLEKNPDQDFLGKLYMQLNLGSHWHGQFFTPYSICKCMSEIIIRDSAVPEAEKRDYISICDPSCGAGATLIAAANTFKQHNINYQQKVMFMGQDIDRVVGQMCYIQLSLLGCAGYIAIANTLTSPVLGPVIEPIEQKGQEFWYTPMYFSNRWTMRRLFGRFRHLESAKTNETQKRNEDEYIFFFDFEKEEKLYGRAE